MKNPTSRYFVLAFFYLALFQISSIFQTTELKATPWNPEAGVAVVAGTLLGWRAVPAVFALNLFGHLYDGSTLPRTWLVLSAFLHAAIFSGFGVFWRKSISDLAVPSTTVVLRFIAFAAGVTFIATLARLVVIAAAFKVPPVYVAPYLTTLTVGNLVGVMTVAPIAVVCPNWTGWTSYFKLFKPFDYALVAMILALSFAVFGLKQTDEFKFFYLVFLPVIAFSIRGGIQAAVFSVVLTDALMIGILFLREFSPSTATELQLLMASLSGTGLILGATVSERGRVSKALEESHIRFQESQAALMQATRMSLANEMAGALAHELNQPLSAIRIFVRTIRRRLSQPRLDRQKLSDDIDAAVAQVDNASDLIKSTRGFLKKGESGFSEVDFSECIEFCVELVERELKSSKIQLVKVIDDDLPPVFGNAQQLQQVLINLIRNAKEAIIQAKSKSRKIELRVNTQSRVDQIEVSVSDTGPGVSPGMRSTLFSPLVSSKPQGLGLGLSLCRSIVQAHGGDIWLDETGQTGARFVFTLAKSFRREI